MQGKGKRADPYHLVELPPIKEDQGDYDAIERQILEAFRRTIYLPLMRLLGEPKSALQNANDALMAAIRSGRVAFNQGAFTGSFSSAISKELRSLGAKFDRRTGAYRLLKSDLPNDVYAAIQASESRFLAQVAKLDRAIAQILPEEITAQISIEKSFERAVWKVEDDFKSSIQGISVAPKLTQSEVDQITKAYRLNLDTYVKKFTTEQMVKLRKDVEISVFSGNRRESMVAAIQKSYGVTENKAKFLARQETNLLMSSFKQTRYESAGVNEYKWFAVQGSAAHPVRHQHRALADASKNGKIFKWSEPPITTEPGEPVRRNNPGQDYNCRCFAKPIVRKKV